MTWRITIASPSNWARITSTGSFHGKLYSSIVPFSVGAVIARAAFDSSLSSSPTCHLCICPIRRSVRAKVWLSRELSTLFDVKSYATDMEDLMFRMWARKESNFPLSHIKAKKKTEEQRRLQQQRQRQHFRSVLKRDVKVERPG